ncbi:MAG: bifunctional demethylmenaquinone methyltransferase/2-methoxy-6-polyprenyl-1,4-benzoquinol methylase UbiE [Opitutales bacterium]
MPQGEQVRAMFAGIAERYDLANRWLSFGIDRGWRRALVRAAEREHPRTVVDLATGSGDVAFALRRRLGAGTAIAGMDFCQPMLDEAEQKQADRPERDQVAFRPGDCLNLPLDDASTDVLTIAFGLRNLEDRHHGLTEMRRALRPGGVLLVLEFTQPAAWLRPFYYCYLKHVLPRLAAWLTRDRSAYEYLAGSIEAFPTKESLSEEMRAAGFDPVEARGMTGSIVALHAARKPAS